jgi:alkanesulfonate monooxygenase SsuD/methylene tetrahydromethanopterin reductase-like flavin-dependent oxidoreductase (luciferase family)
VKVGVLIDPRLPGSADFAVAAEAREAVPVDLGRLTNLVGTPSAIAERVRRCREAGITTLLAKLDGEYPHQLATLERLVAIVGDDRTGNG